MARLIEADPALLEAILDGTYPIWNEGLTREAYSAWNRGQMRTAWGLGHLRRVALVEGDSLLASAKRYDFRAVVQGREVEVLGIGAVFTPVERRRRGHARELIDLMMTDAAGRGAEFALLFSEIDPAYYAAMGFREIARPLSTISVRTRAGAPATFVRSGTPADLPALAEISARYRVDGSGFALIRGADLIEFAFARRRLLAGLGVAGRREIEFFVAEEGHQPVAYVFITHGPAGAVLEECGDRDPSGARIGAILQVLAARTPHVAPLALTGWLPSSIRPPQLSIEVGLTPVEVMMIRALRSATTADWANASVTYWQTDTF